jgi:transposase
MKTQRKNYPSDLSDGEWARLECYIPAAKAGGRPAKYERREIVNGILYVLRAGGSWRMLPHDFPP